MNKVMIFRSLFQTYLMMTTELVRNENILLQTLGKCLIFLYVYCGDLFYYILSCLLVKDTMEY